jgi:hypothetical protein
MSLGAAFSMHQHLPQTPQETASPASSPAAAAAAGGGAVEATVLTGGFDTLHNALSAARRASLLEARQHQELAGRLRALQQQVAHTRAAQGAVAARLTGRAQESIKATLAAVSRLQRAQASVARSRLEADDAAERMRALTMQRHTSAQAAGAGNGSQDSAATGASQGGSDGGGNGGTENGADASTPSVGGGAPFASAISVDEPSDQEVAKRAKRLREAMHAATTAEDLLRDCADEVVSARRRRDDELRAISKQLQRLDEDRQAFAKAALDSLAAATVQAVDAALQAASHAARMAALVDCDLDVRTFVHQRRVAIMLQELIARGQSAAAAAASVPAASRRAEGASQALWGGAASAPDDADTAANIIPYPLSASRNQLFNKDYVLAEADIAPTMFRWALALLKDEGSEVIQGLSVPFADEVSAAPVAQAGRASESESTTDPTAESAVSVQPSRSPVFEVSAVNSQAARTALLRALSSRRSLRQNLGSSFPRFCRVFWWTLDACRAQEDTRSAQVCLILAETFFHFQGERKVFLQDKLINHPIWKRDFWHEAFYRMARDEVAKLIDPAATSHARLTHIFAEVERQMSAAATTPSPAGEDTSLGSNKSQEEGTPNAIPSPHNIVQFVDPTNDALSSFADPEQALMAYTQILFGQLSSLSLNISSSLPISDDPNTFIVQLATANGLSREMTSLLCDSRRTHN